MKINEKNLCMFATSPPYDYEGFLNKRGEVNKAFQRRYFVLKGNLLFYFEKKGDKEPLGLIIVEGCTIELSEESDQYCFQIVFNGNRSYILCADSQESMEAWMKVLTCAGYEYKRLMVAELQRQLDEIEKATNKKLDKPKQTSTPKPPPRRQNPFNRPAPLPPQLTTPNPDLSNGFSGNKTTVKESSSSSDIVAASASTTALPLLASTRDTTRASPSPSTQRAGKKVLTASEVFKTWHEAIGKVVRKDIEEFRARQELANKPLVDI